MQTLQEFGYSKQIRVTGRPSVHHFRQEVLDFSDDMRQCYNWPFHAYTNIYTYITLHYIIRSWAPKFCSIDRRLRTVIKWYDIWYYICYDRIWCDIWYDIIWYDMMWCDVMWYDTIWYMIYNMIWYDRIYMIWYIIWYDMIGYIWYDIWYNRIGYIW